MSTAVFPGNYGPVLVKGKTRPVPSLLSGRGTQVPADLTIHRITKTHHGRTLLTLGHAAEYLANTWRFRIDEMDESDAEAVHILMELGREVFEEFAEQRSMMRRVEGWMVEKMVGLLY